MTLATEKSIATPHKRIDDLGLDKFAWQRVILSAAIKNATRRYVLLAMSVWMDDVPNDKGSYNCYPGTRIIADRTGLSERAVCTHIEGAELDGWIERRRKSRGKDWRLCEYIPCIPVGTELPSAANGTERSSAASSEVLNGSSNATEPGDPMVLNEVLNVVPHSTNTPIITNQSTNQPRLQEGTEVHSAANSNDEQPPDDEPPPLLDPYQGARWKHACAKSGCREVGRYPAAGKRWCSNHYRTMTPDRQGINRVPP